MNYQIIMLSNMTGTSNSASFSSPFLKVFDNRSCDIRKKIDIWITNKNILKQNTDHSSNLPKNWKW